MPSSPRVIDTECPACGPTRMTIVLEGSAHYIGIDTPNWSTLMWVGRCRWCHGHFQAYPEDEHETDRMVWEPMEEDRLEFLIGPR